MLGGVASARTWTASDVATRSGGHDRALPFQRHLRAVDSRTGGLRVTWAMYWYLSPDCWDPFALRIGATSAIGLVLVATHTIRIGRVHVWPVTLRPHAKLAAIGLVLAVSRRLTEMLYRLTPGSPIGSGT